MKRFHFSAIRHGKKCQNVLEPDAALELPSVEAARQAADEAMRDMVGDLPPGPGKVALIVRDEAGAVTEIRPLRRAKG